MRSTTPDIASMRTDSAENWPSVVGEVDTEMRDSGAVANVRSSFSAG